MCARGPLMASANTRARPRAGADAILALIAAAALGSGIVVYALDREVPAYFLPAAWHLARSGGSWLGAVGGVLPAFVHAYTFVVLTVAVVPSPKRALSICGFWLTVDSLFELGQHPAIAPYTAAAIPPSFHHLPVLEAARSYFLRGTFDPWDLIAIAAGITGAYLTVTRVRHRRRRYGPRA